MQKLAPPGSIRKPAVLEYAHYTWHWFPIWLCLYDRTRYYRMLLQSGNSHQLVPTDSLTTNGQHQFGARSLMVLRDVFCSHRFAVILIVRCIRWICTDLCHQRNLHVDDHLPFRSSHNLSQPPPFTRTVNSIPLLLARVTNNLSIAIVLSSCLASPQHFLPRVL